MPRLLTYKLDLCISCNTIHPTASSFTRWVQGNVGMDRQSNSSSELLKWLSAIILNNRKVRVCQLALDAEQTTLVAKNNSYLLSLQFCRLTVWAELSWAVIWSQLAPLAYWGLAGLPWSQLGQLVSVPFGLSSSSRPAQAWSHGCGNELYKVSWGLGSEKAYDYFCHILWAKANHQSSPDLRSGKTDYTSRRSCKLSQEGGMDRGGIERFWLFLQVTTFFPCSAFLISRIPC